MAPGSLLRWVIAAGGRRQHIEWARALGSGRARRVPDGSIVPSASLSGSTARSRPEYSPRVGAATRSGETAATASDSETSTFNSSGSKCSARVRLLSRWVRARVFDSRWMPAVGPSPLATVPSSSMPDYVIASGQRTCHVRRRRLLRLACLWFPTGVHTGPSRTSPSLLAARGAEGN